jgi:NTE family protein
MKARARTPSTKAPVDWGKFDHKILVLQGGGALGAYQAGVYEGLVQAGFEPGWISGVSIGAINATLIAGNQPQHRVQRLREFWQRVSALASFVPSAPPDTMRSYFNAMGAASAVMIGVSGFFVPRMPPPFMAPDGSLAALSFYDTQPLKATLEELADFDLINSKAVRLSLGAVNVCTGESVYFDNTKMPIGPEHVMASGALPPGFPPVSVDGQWYWDGGISSNTPLWYVVDEAYLEGGIVVQVDVFSGSGTLPANLHQVQQRMKDLQYASKMRFGRARLSEQEELRESLRRVLAMLPEKVRTDPDVQRLTAISTRGKVVLAHLTNHHDTQSSDFKDYDFSRSTVTELWEGGLGDVRRAIEQEAWLQTEELARGIKVVDLTPVAPPHQEQTP